jgi:hypothetical protein
MEYGDDELRVVTELDQVEAPRQIRRVNVDGQEKAILLDMKGHRRRWDFTVEHPIYGKLVCSYYPKAALRQLEGHFGRGFSGDQDGTLTITRESLVCTDAGMEYLQRQIQQGIHDALIGLVIEAQTHGLFLCDGQEFVVTGLESRKRGMLKSLVTYHETVAKQRQGLDKPGRPQKWSGPELDEAVPLAMEKISPQRLVTPDKVAEELTHLYPHKEPFPSGAALKQKIGRACKIKWGDMKKRDIIRRNSVPVNINEGMVKDRLKD